MPRYVDTNRIPYYPDYSEVPCSELKFFAYKEDIDNIATANVQEVKHGKWSRQGFIVDEYGDKHLGYVCSVCKKFVPNKGNYCLECGAKMDGE